MNNKGFMMAEVVVVSAIILVFMAGIYTSYNKIFAVYRQRVNYYDVTTLYKLGYYRDLLIDYDKINQLIEETDNIEDISDIVSSIDNRYNDKVFFVYNKKLNLNDRKNSEILDSFESFDINPTFKDYIDFLSTSADLTSNYVMIMETCSSEDDCTYAYLEVYDGTE